MAFALLGVGVVAAPASATIDGTVANRAGVPLADVAIELRDGRGVAAAGATDESGQFRLDVRPGRSGPFTLSLVEFDECRVVGDPGRDVQREVPSIAEGATGLAVVMNVLDVCQGRPPAKAPPARDATVDALARAVVGRPGGLVDVRVRLPFAAGDPRLLLADGTRISARSREGFDDLRAMLPRAAYGGPLLLAYESQPTGRTVTRGAGTLVTRAAPRPITARAGALDTVVLVDLSRSTRRSDAAGMRRRVVRDLGRLAGRGERFGVIGFDDRVTPIFGLQPLDSSAARRRLAARATARIVSRGGSDYDVAFGAAWEAIRTAGRRPRSSKLVVFVTDGAHAGPPFRSTHLRFAFADVLAGAEGSWPVCVIQMGRLPAADEARLARIARETAGERRIVGSAEGAARAALGCRTAALGGRAAARLP